VLVDICCDICDKSCKHKHIIGAEEFAPGITEEQDCEYATVSATWGYFSRKDGESYHIDLCEDCFDKVAAHINKLRAESIAPS
jgi:hypothetical protein